MAPCPALQPRGSSAASSFRAPAPSCADRVSFDPSHVMMQDDAASDGKRRRRPQGGDDDSRASKKRAVGRVASPVTHLSCARIRPFVHTSRPKEETKVTVRAVRGDAHDVIMKQNIFGSISCKKIEPAPRPKSNMPKRETSSSAQVGTRTVAHGVITKQKAGENIPRSRIRPAVQASGIKDKTKFSSVGVLRNGADSVVKSKQEASERVLIKTKQEATVTKNILQIRPPAPAANHRDPHTPQDALRAALAAARQAWDRRHNVYGRQREEARRELDKVVQTVFFNDPYITCEDVLRP